MQRFVCSESTIITHKKDMTLMQMFEVFGIESHSFIETPTIVGELYKAHFAITPTTVGLIKFSDCYCSAKPF